MTKYVAEYYVGSYNMIGLFEAKSEQEVKDYLIKKYGEIVKISQIVKLADQSISISSMLEGNKNTMKEVEKNE